MSLMGIVTLVLVALIILSLLFVLFKAFILLLPVAVIAILIIWLIYRFTGRKNQDNMPTRDLVFIVSGLRLLVLLVLDQEKKLEMSPLKILINS